HPTSLNVIRRDIFTQIPSSTGVQSRVTMFYNNVVAPTEVDEYDFGSGAVGSLLRTTITSYGSWNGSSCVALGTTIRTRPCPVIVQDGSGHQASKTNFRYNTSTGNLTDTDAWVSGTTYLSSQ